MSDRIRASAHIYLGSGERPVKLARVSSAPLRRDAVLAAPPLQAVLRHVSAEVELHLGGRRGKHGAESGRHRRCKKTRHEEKNGGGDKKGALKQNAQGCEPSQEERDRK